MSKKKEKKIQSLLYDKLREVNQAKIEQSRIALKKASNLFSNLSDIDDMYNLTYMDDSDFIEKLDKKFDKYIYFKKIFNLHQNMDLNKPFLIKYKIMADELKKYGDLRFVDEFLKNDKVKNWGVELNKELVWLKKVEPSFYRYREYDNDCIMFRICDFDIAGLRKEYYPANILKGINYLENGNKTFHAKIGYILEEIIKGDITFFNKKLSELSEDDELESKIINSIKEYIMINNKYSNKINKPVCPLCYNELSVDVELNSCLYCSSDIQAEETLSVENPNIY